MTFTFQYGATSTCFSEIIAAINAVFTFQYGATSTCFSEIIAAINAVFTFQYGATSTPSLSLDIKRNKIYIPIWSYFYVF